MELIGPHERCILCGTEGPLSRAHLFPESVGGFAWSRTHCKQCNEKLGSEVEAGVKNDDTIRLAIEHGLASELPELAERFSAGQQYIRKTDHGTITAKKVGGDYRIRSQRSDDLLTQPEDEARTTVRNMLRKQGASQAEIEEAVTRLDAAPAQQGDEFIPIAPTLRIRKGAVDEWQLPLDGQPLSPMFPAAIAFHFLALALGEDVYNSALDPIRESIQNRTLDPRYIVVESLRGTGLEPSLLVGLAQTEPHMVVRVQLFGEALWRVHFPSIAAEGDESIGILLDLKTEDIELVRRADSGKISLPAIPEEP